MKSSFSEVWEKIRNLIKYIWNDVKTRLKSETGAIEITLGKKRAAPKEKSKEWAEDWISETLDKSKANKDIRDQVVKNMGKKVDDQFKTVDDLIEYLIKETEKQKAINLEPRKVPVRVGDIYSQNRETIKSQTFFNKLLDEIKRAKSEPKKIADEYLGAISTRLANINPLLKAHLRKYEFKRMTMTVKRIKNVEPLLKKIRTMTLNDQMDFDLARRNGDAKKLQQLIIKYRLGLEYGKLRKLLDNMRDEALSVGLDVGYQKHYHPRKIKDMKGFLEYFRNQDSWPVIKQVIKEKEVELGRYLEEDEKASLINTLLRGYKSGGISLAKPGQLKEREIEVVWPEINKFYMSSDGALLNYINEVTDIIEAKKLFGKAQKKKDLPLFGVTYKTASDSVGDYVLRLLNEKKIKPDQEQELREIYNARFNEIGTRGGFTLYKNMSYIDTMGSPISAITQIGDLAWSFYKNGPIKTAKAAIKSLIGKSEVTRNDIGIERIAQEFIDTSKTAKAVTKVFKWTGLEKIDAIGKEALINATLSRAQKKANDPKQVNKLRKELDYFEGETDQLIEDLKNGNITENVKLHLFNTLLDFQPVALSEMPQKYLTGGNGRIFYMLKTFTLKQFDVFRREAIQKIAKKGTRIEGIKNLIWLAACFAGANATADLIKALILGRPIDPDDIIVDNLLRLFGISKWVTWRAREEGVGSAMLRQILPPAKAIDALYKDIASAGDEKGLETPSSIPIVGKLYYWWFGKGAGKSDRKQKEMLIDKYFDTLAEGGDLSPIRKEINAWNRNVHESGKKSLKINIYNYGKRRKEAMGKRK